MIYAPILRKSFRFLKNTAICIACVTLAGVGMLYLRLSLGPIDISFMKEIIEESLNREKNIGSLEILKPELRWQGFGYPIELHGSNIRLHHSMEHNLRINIPEIRATFRLRNLLLGEATPARLVLVRPEFFIEPDINGLLSRNNIKAPQQDFSLPRILDPSNDSRLLKELILENARVNIGYKTENGEQWTSARIDLDIARKKGAIDLLLNIELEGKQSLNIKASHSPEDKNWQGIASINEINPSTLLSLIPLPFQPLLAPSIPEILKGLDMKITGTLEGRYSTTKGPEQIKINLETPEGKITLVDWLPSPLMASNIIFHAFLDGNKLEVPELSLVIPDGRIYASFVGELDKSKQNMVFSARGALRDFSMAKLAKYWPTNLALAPRSWVIKNIPEGEVPEASLNLQGHADLATGKLDIVNLQGEINLEKTIVTYMEGMPAVTNVHGRATFDREKFLIAIKGGQSLNELKVQNGQVDILNLDKERQNIAITLDITGPLAKAMELIDSKPLGFAREMGLSANNCRGNTQTVLKLSFPLETTLLKEQIDVQVKSRIRDMVLVNPVRHIPVLLTRGNAELGITNGHLILSGNADLNGDASTLRWERHFRKTSPFSSRLNISTRLSPNGARHLPGNPSRYFTGHVQTHICHEVRQNQTGSLNISADLKKAALNFWGWKKELFLPGTVSADLEFDNGGSPYLKKLQALSGDQLKINISGDSPKTNSESLDIREFVLGNTRLRGKLRSIGNLGYRLQVAGDLLDLEPWLNRFEDDEARKTVNDSSKTMEIFAHFKRISVGTGKVLYKNALNLVWQNDRIRNMSFTGHITPDSMEAVYLNLFPRSNGRRFVLKSNNAGNLLKSLGIFENIRGGKLKLAANNNDEDPLSLWQGKLFVEDFRVLKVPFLGRLLSMAFPSGIEDMLSGNEGLPFDQIKIRFRANHRRIILDSGRAFGSSLGFTINGTLENYFRVLKIHGSIIPAYFLNTLVAKIPLLGQIITGGKDEGLFGVSYTIEGLRNAPRIQINPVSALTPGFLRKLFAPEDSNTEEFGEEINDQTEEDEGSSS